MSRILLPDDGLGGVTTVNTVYDTELTASLRELSRVRRPGGHLVVGLADTNHLSPPPLARCRAASGRDQGRRHDQRRLVRSYRAFHVHVATAPKSPLVSRSLGSAETRAAARACADAPSPVGGGLAAMRRGRRQRRSGGSGMVVAGCVKPGDPIDDGIDAVGASDVAQPVRRAGRSRSQDQDALRFRRCPTDRDTARIAAGNFGNRRMDIAVHTPPRSQGS
ncbi:hypothetical protein [Nocardia transvalensis]|uniref:hypothetical protein n=1 Tax=Nocardia transvalensis TaxID=37333 RepID=UPI001895134C|nr:hypothetical protein [Nocardia transvalensis]MBF6333633.1 hypothetical protein [Nocardia transvalensis]